MARKKNGAPAEAAFDDYRHDTKRKNNPPASIAAEGKLLAAPKLTYSYSPRLDPKLRFDDSGRADRLPELLETARTRALTADEAQILAEALRAHQPWLEWAGKREVRGVSVDPVALYIHERVSTEALLRVAARQDVTRDLFADPQQEDANNVTQILGLRAFGSQLLCEQVVGRGLRRMDYIPDPETGLLTEEHVDVYGIPFSVIPFKGRPVTQKEPEDRPKNHVRTLPERADMEMGFPVVEGYAFALTKNRIRCDIERMERLRIEPNREPTGTFVSPTVGYRVGSTADSQAPFGFATQDRSTYYAQVHLQTILFQVTQRIVDELTVGATLASSDKRRRVLALQARHQLFPKVLVIAERYVERKVDFQGVPKAELGLKRYVDQVVERIRDAIVPDDSEGEPPLLPLLNRYKETGTTAEVDFKTTRPCFATQHSHINQVVADTLRWEQSAAFRLEQAAQAGIVRFYAKNDSLGLVIPYEFLGSAA